MFTDFALHILKQHKSTTNLVQLFQRLQLHTTASAQFYHATEH